MLSGQEMSAILNACKILNVKLSSSIDDVKKAFRQQASLYHPDKNKSIDAEEQFKKINNARDLLLTSSVRNLLAQIHLAETLETMSATENPQETFYSYDNPSPFFQPPKSTTTNNKPCGQSNWEFEDFMIHHDSFQFKGVAGEFKGDHVTFFHYASASPFISFTFKFDQQFYENIYNKISSVLSYNLWTTNSIAEAALKFSLPRDNKEYEKVLSILFAEYKLPKEYLNFIMNKEFKYEFMPRPEKNFGR